MKTTLCLENNLVKLIPLQLSQQEELWPIAQQVDLYQYGSTGVSTKDKLKIYIQNALNEAAAGKSIPFTIYNKQTSECVGCTRFGN